MPISLPVRRVILFLAVILLSIAPAGAQSISRHVLSLDLKHEHAVPTRYTGSAFPAQSRPLSLQAADFDEDGVPDLVAGYTAPGGQGVVTLHRGNLAALWPYDARARMEDPAAFLPDARVFAVSEPPDFLAVGDFDGDGHQDIALARRGGTIAYILPGDGRGGFGNARQIPLPGGVTALIAGDVNRPDGLADLIVAVSGPESAKLLVFESPAGALRAVPEVFALQDAAVSLVVGNFGGAFGRDIAAAGGARVTVIRGRDRKLSLNAKQREGVAPAEILSRSFPFHITGATAGNFSGAGDGELVLASDDGGLHLLSAPLVSTVTDGTAPVPAGDARRSGRTERAASSAAMGNRSVLRADNSRPFSDWELTEVRGVSGLGKSAVLLRSHVSNSRADDLVVVDGASLHAVGFGQQRGAGEVLGSAALEDQAAAVLPMRLGVSALESVVLLTPRTRGPIALTAVSVPTTYTVTTAADHDDGVCDTDCTLREAINAANAHPGADTIAFAIPGGGVHTIQPSTALPVITEAVTIDGYTQTGASANTAAAGDNAVLLIEISGASAPKGTSGIQIAASNCVIRGLVINRFSPQSDGPVFFDGFGITLLNNAAASSNRIEGNFIGTDANGTSALGNGNAGIGVFGTNNNNTFGGTTAAARNLISSNLRGELLISGANASSGNVIEGNFIGTDRSGSASLGSSTEVYLFNAPATTVGGLTVSSRNILSGGGTGISFNGNGTNALTGTVVQGNYIGLDVTGFSALGNNGGIDYNAASGTTVGGTVAGAANYISGNLSSGINMAGIGTSGNVIQGNFIGTDVSGAIPLGNNGDGISIANATGNTIGGTAAGAGNTIAFNGGNGVTVTGTGAGGTDGSQNSIEGNSIYANVFGIDLGADGPTANNHCNVNRAGANQLQNYPVLTSTPAGSLTITATATDPNGNTSEFSTCALMNAAGGNLNFTGTLDSVPSTTFKVDFYRNDACDASGNGQGQVYLGSTNVTTSASCIATIDTTIPFGPAPVPVSITATAGTPQSAAVNTAFGTAMKAVVKDATSTPLAGVSVTFTAPGSGASGAFTGSSTVTTDSSGVATAPAFTANGTAGAYTVTATAGSVTASFNLTNTAAVPASITATAGTPQSAPVNSAFATALKATVKDASNNPLSGVSVTFTAPNSGASGTFTGSATVLTNSLGVATAPAFTANSTIGGYTVTATAGALTASFSLTNTVGATTITATAGTPQSAAVGSTFGTSLQATVRDPGNQPVGGVSVTFTAPNSGPGGTFTGSATVLTNSSGVATAPLFTANTTAGAYTVIATYSGLPATFSLTNTAGPAASITAVAGSPQSAPVTTRFATALQAQVRDSFGNVAPGVSVTFVAPSSGASGAFTGSATVTTNAAGIATAPAFTANGTTGTYVVNAQVGERSASFNLTNTLIPVAGIQAISGSGQNTQPNNSFAGTLVARVFDSLGNPVANVSVTFTLPSSGASGAFQGMATPLSATVNTNAQGLATSPAIVANSISGTFSAIASTGAFQATFGLSTVIPQVTVTPSSLVFHYEVNGALPPSQPLTVTATNGAFSTSVDSPWIKTANGSAGTVNVSIDPTGLKPNYYSGSVNISGQIVPVLLIVTSQPLVRSTPASLAFQYTQGSATVPVPQDVVVAALVRNFSFSITTQQITATKITWLQAAITGVATTPATVHVTVNPGLLDPGVYQGAIQVISPDASNSPFSIPVTLTVLVAPPAITTVQNAATFQTGPVSSSEIVSVYGTNLACPHSPLLLAGGLASQVLSANATQVNVVLPDLTGKTSIALQFVCDASQSLPFPIAVAASAPGIFVSGGSRAAAYNQGFTPNAPATPAARGGIVMLFGTGFGPLMAADSNGLRWLASTLTITVGGVPAQVTFDGEAPGLPGVVQINIVIPAGAPAGDAVPVQITLGGVTLPSTLTISVQ